MKSLHVLARLAGQAVDEAQQILRQINHDIETVEQQIEQLGKAAIIEAGHGKDFMTAGATLPAYLGANKRLIEEAFERLQALRLDYKNQHQQMMEKRIELKRFELLLERHHHRLAKERAAQEQRKLDDLVAAKAARNPRKLV